MTNVPCFFGYGSLVNTQTHDYPNPLKAQLNGWRRMWRHTTLREIAILTVTPDPSCEIEGLIAHVPDNNWSTLDEREVFYTRTKPNPEQLSYAGMFDVQLYETRTDADCDSSVQHPILMSYLDVVVQGYLHQFGEQGVDAFFATTSGWGAPIHNDRAAPIYPRSQILTTAETSLVDHHLSALSAQVQKL